MTVENCLKQLSPLGSSVGLGVGAALVGLAVVGSLGFLPVGRYRGLLVVVVASVVVVGVLLSGYVTSGALPLVTLVGLLRLGVAVVDTSGAIDDCPTGGP